MAMTISSELIRAARALLRWEQKELAERSGVSLPSIKRLETQPGALAAHTRTVQALTGALETAGIEFLNHGQPGVRLRPLSPAGQEQTNLMYVVDFIEEAGGSLLEASLPIGLRVADHSHPSTVERAIAAGLVVRDGKMLRLAAKPVGLAADRGKGRKG